LLPAALSVWSEHVAAQRQSGLGADAALPPAPSRRPLRDALFGAGSLLIAGCVVAVIATVVLGSAMRLWPYRLEFTLKHYAITMAGGYAPLWTSLQVSLVAAVAGAVLLASLAFAVRRLPPAAARGVALLAALPVAVPGRVLGIGR